LEGREGNRAKDERKGVKASGRKRDKASKIEKKVLRGSSKQSECRPSTSWERARGRGGGGGEMGSLWGGGGGGKMAPRHIEESAPSNQTTGTPRTKNAI